MYLKAHCPAAFPQRPLLTPRAATQSTASPAQLEISWPRLLEAFRVVYAAAPPSSRSPSIQSPGSILNEFHCHFLWLRDRRGLPQLLQFARLPTALRPTGRPLNRPSVRGVARAPSTAPTRHRRSRSPLHLPCIREGEHSRPPSVGTEPTPLVPASRPATKALAGEREQEGPCASGPSPLARPASRSASNSAQSSCSFGPHGLVPRGGAVAFSEISETTLLLSREYAPPPPLPQGRAAPAPNCRPQPGAIATLASQSPAEVPQEWTQITNPNPG